MCIDCGECIRVCQHHAKVAVTDPFESIRRFKYRVALPAPALYGQFKTLESIAVLASALRELERDGLILRREYLEVPVRVEYAPTEDCRRLLPILEQLSDWAEARMPADESTTKKEEPQ